MIKHSQQFSKSTAALKKVSAQHLKVPSKGQMLKQSQGPIRSEFSILQNGSVLQGQRNLPKHYASTNQAMYSPFQKEVYIPPHLDSRQISHNVFHSQPAHWYIRKSSKKYDYDQLYSINQSRYSVKKSVKQKDNRSRRWSSTKSKIKDLIDEDKQSYLRFESKKGQKIAKKTAKKQILDSSENSSIQ